MDDVIYSHSNPDEISALANQLVAFQEELTSYQDALAPIKDALGAIHQEKSDAYQIYLAIVAKIAENEAALTAQRNELNNKVRQQQKNIASIERQLADAQRIERIKAKNEELNKQLEDVLQTAKWFGQILTHQFEAAKRITRYRHMILADAPGLGKTLTALATADLVKEATANARPDNPFGYDPDDKVTGVNHQAGKKILYVCPAPLLRNVIREVQLWTDRDPVLMGNQPRRTRQLLIQTLNGMDEFIVIINYEAWRRDSALLADLKALQFDFVVLDEAHTLKDRKTGAYKSIKSLLGHRSFMNVDMPEFNADQENGRGYWWTEKQINTWTPFVMCMTGTPILNKPQDLFSLLSLVDPDHFWNENYFLRDYCQQDWYTKRWSFRPGGLDSLGKRISNIYLRRTKRDAGIILPGKHEEIHELEVDEENYPLQASARKQMKNYGMILLSAEKRLTAAAEIAIYTRLRQIETWPAGIVIKDENGVVQLKLEIEESQKIDYLIRKQEDDYIGLLADLCDGGLREGASCVVFSQFKAPLRELRDRCTSAGISAVVLDGDTPESVRDEIIRDFDRRHTSDEQAKWQVVLANYRVGGVGVTLTRATELIMLDSEWSAGREEQATDRVHRIGQTEDVTIHKILTTGTIDSWLDEIVQAKRAMNEGFDANFDFSAIRDKLME